MVFTLLTILIKKKTNIVVNLYNLILSQEISKSCTSKQVTSTNNAYRTG